MENDKITLDDIIQKFKDLGADKRVIGVSALGISQYWIRKLIHEGMTEFKKRHGFLLSGPEQHHTDDELFQRLDKTVSELVSIPKWDLLTRTTGITQKKWMRLSGHNGIRGLYSNYRRWLETYQPESENLKLVDEYLADNRKTGNDTHRESKKAPINRRLINHELAPGGPTFGSAINFRNLLFAPVEESGVVFLFGMVSQELGFTIERIGAKYPDCLAKYFDKKTKRLRNVKIEFELNSSEFRAHGHDPDGCDFIVCWKDDWRDRPKQLKVIELQSIIKQLQNPK